MTQHRAISNIMVGILRHRPYELVCGLNIDGWAKVSDLSTAVMNYSGLAYVDDEEIVRIAKQIDSPRFEVSKDIESIRAKYGHSKYVDFAPPTASEPPTILYHATPHVNVTAICHSEGLKSMSRKYVHLSTHKLTAIAAATRQNAHQLVTLHVSAALAYQQGVSFHRANDAVWLAGDIPPIYLSY